MGFRVYLKIPFVTKALAFSGFKGFVVVFFLKNCNKEPSSNKKPMPSITYIIIFCPKNENDPTGMYFASRYRNAAKINATNGGGILIFISLKYYFRIQFYNDGMKLVFATHNQNKFEEVKLLMPKHIELLSLNIIACFDEIEENGTTLEENAQLKADFVTKNYNYNCFSDDTGLLVDALGGAPGVYTARYAGAAKDTNANMAKLLNELDGVSNRSACFKTAIALNINSKKHLFNGIVEGVIAHKKIGKGGFGYDPIFIPEGYNKTFAELPLTVKNKISHRGRAIQKLITFLNSL